MGKSLTQYATFYVFVVVAYMAGDALGTSPLTKVLVPAIVLGIAAIGASRSKCSAASLSRAWRGLVLLPWIWVFVNFIRYRLTGLPDADVLAASGTTVLLVGITEELACRYTAHRLLGPVPPALFLLLNSLVFGLLHTYQGWMGIAVNTLIGATFDIARMRGASMSMLIVCHSLINVPHHLPNTERVVGVHCAWAALGAAALTWLFFLLPGFWRNTKHPSKESLASEAGQPHP
jgi:hypothetical protein